MDVSLILPEIYIYIYLMVSNVNSPHFLKKLEKALKVLPQAYFPYFGHFKIFNYGTLPINSNLVVS